MKPEDVFQLIRLDSDEELLESINLIDINELNEFGQNLLHEAIAYGKEKIAIEFIKMNLDVNHQDSKGQTPLHYAAVHNQRKIAETILNNSGNLNITDVYGNQPLWSAVFNARGNYEIVELFNQYGADARHMNEAGRSPLDFAKQIQDQSMLEILTKARKGVSH